MHAFVSKIGVNIGDKLMKSAIMAMLMAIQIFLFGAASAAPTTQPINLVVGYPPGGGGDIMARMLAEQLHKEFGQAVIVDNKPGAGTIIGTNYVVHAKPNGSTVLLNIVETMAINQYLYKNIPYDLEADLDPVATIATTSRVLVANPSFPIKTLGALVKYAKSHPNELAAGSIGVGSIQHLCIELLNGYAKTEIRHIPYSGGGPVLTAVMGNQIPLAFVGAAPVAPLVAQKKLVAIATTGEYRDPALPHVPTFSELGFPIVVEGTYAIFVPKGTPTADIKSLEAALKRISMNEKFRIWLKSQDYSPKWMASKELRTFVASNLSRWKPLVEKLKATKN